MKKFIALLMMLAGAAITLYAGYYVLIEPGRMLIWGYHPMYPGLLGITLLTFGIITHSS